MKVEKSPTKAEYSHKIADQLVLAINEEVNLETMKAVDQEQVVIALKTLHHARWWQVMDALLIRRVVIIVIYGII